MLELGDETLRYEYRSRRRQAPINRVGAWIPHIGTRLTLEALSQCSSAGFEEGYLFNPYFTLRLQYALEVGDEVGSCLRVEEA